VKDALLEDGVIPSDHPRLEQIVDEVEYALHPPRHEGKYPSYGCILTEAIPDDPGQRLPVQHLTKEVARQLADGVSSFAVRVGKKHKRVALRPSASDEELDLIDLAGHWQGVLVHRSQLGVVRVFSPWGIFIQEGGEWKHRPHADSVLFEVTDHAPTAKYKELQRLLRFAFHMLSPANVGATLVWWLKPAARPAEDGTNLSNAGISITEKTHLPALRAILRQHDGATFLSPAGKVESIGHQLRYSEKAAKYIEKVGGTRHTSAKRYSFDEERVIVVVVSEDGPVSVFSDGVKVTELAQYEPGELGDYLRNLVPEKAEDIYEESTEATCPTCGRHIWAEVVIIAGLRERETGECPVCGTTVIKKLCWQINTRVVKRL
jgi:DNA integrity scanning protein DisA with diadenylate cyclase activity